jgi:ABC-type enterochelin transport system ATPase subunit
MPNNYKYRVRLARNIYRIVTEEEHAIVLVKLEFNFTAIYNNQPIHVKHTDV